MLPGVGGIAVFSPRLDPHGNSVRGLRVFEELAKEFGLHLFDPDRVRGGATRRRPADRSRQIGLTIDGVARS